MIYLVTIVDSNVRSIPFHISPWLNSISKAQPTISLNKPS